jgi:threonine/homoserine/homoserine lactone efflux protein
MYLDFIEGYLIGLGMIVFIGPVFFLLLSTTLEKGTMAGMLVATGIIVSDLLYVILCKFGVTMFLTQKDNLKWTALANGLLLIIIGIKYLKGQQSLPMAQEKMKAKQHGTFFLQGFLVNFVNPFVLAIWIGLITYAEQKSELNANIYLAGVLLGIFSLDVLKVILAKQIKHLIKPSILQWTYRVFGLILILFGLRMFTYFYFENFQ